MIIITSNNKAVMFYTESQWLDAAGSNLPTGATVYRVPNSTPRSNILGRSSQLAEPAVTFTNPLYDNSNPEAASNESIIVSSAVEEVPAVPAMTEAEVQAIATETLSL